MDVSDRHRRRGLLRHRAGGPPAQGGRRGLRRARTRRRRRRDVALQHVSRLRLRRPVAPVLVLVRAQPGLDAHLLAPARDPRLPRARGRGFGVSPKIRLNTEVPRRRLGRGRAALADRDQPGRVTAQVLVSGTGPLVEPKIPDFPGLETLHRARSSTPRAGITRRPARQAGGQRRHRRLGDPVRPAIAPDVEQLYVFQRTPPWVMPHSARPVKPVERRCYRALPALRSARSAAGSTPRAS